MTVRPPLIHYVPISLACMLLVACAGISDWGGGPSLGAKAAEVAVEMIDTPYRYGGQTPDEGFDCSGLVHYSYQQAGVQSVPRDTKGQLSKSKPVFNNPKKGDLVFFNLDDRYASHVGIYIGGDDFVHAPSTGKHVHIASLSKPYWKERFVGFRRLEAVVALRRSVPHYQWFFRKFFLSDLAA